MTKPFFAFHHANAFEENGIIHMDIVTYKDAGIITGDSLYKNSKNDSKDNSKSQLVRFSLNLTSGEITSDVLLPVKNEFPRINENLDGKPYHYVYTVGFNEKADTKNGQLNSKGLYKINTATKEILEWSEKGCSTGEPVFVSAPNAKEEDDGVVLAVILDHNHNNSFLLILNGKTFKEIGRVRAPHQIPDGLHGQYFTKE